MKRILSIDGGGMYGVVPAEWCIAIEEHVGQPIAGLFDLMAGTSTGSILTAAFTQGIPAAEAADLYMTEGKVIFRKPRPLFFQLSRPKYRGEQLRDVLDRFLGAAGPLGDVHPLLMITAYDMNTSAPEFFKSWHDHERDIRLVDAVVASSTVPTYHPMHEINGTCYVDGGLFATNPAMCALAEARKLWPDEELYLVTLGTGYQPERRPCTKKQRQWGLIKWAQELPFVLLDGQYDMVAYQLEHLVPSLPGVRSYRLDVKLTQEKKADETDPGVLMAARREARQKAEQDPGFAEMIEVLRAARLPV